MFKKASTSEWIKRLESAGIPCAPVFRVSQALNNEHVRYRKMVLELEHPKAGRIPVLGSAFKFSETPGEVRSPPPLRGQHSEEILSELGFRREEIEKLRREGAIQ